METTSPIQSRLKESSLGTSPANRRVHDRKEFSVEVGLMADYQFYTGFTQNISSGGLFISTHELHPIGSRFEATFRIPDTDHLFNCTCEVRWLRTFENGAVSDLGPGIGVQFVDLSPRERELIDTFIEETDTLFHED